jgi:cell division protein ZapA
VSEVALSVGGRVYRVACAAGEEEHVSRLGAVIDEKLASMGNLSGHDAQNLLFAALLLADEVHEGRDTVASAAGEIAAAQALAGGAAGEIEELKTALGNSEAEVEQLQSARHDAAHELEAAQARLAEMTERLAERLSNEDALQSQIDALTQVRDELAARPQTASPAGAPVEGDLGPALERLAEMLEQTADKLESGLRTP